MISNTIRDRRRLKNNKISKTLERKLKESKCRNCSVVVTRMDFAKILGKFTKVKIQYESVSSPKSKSIPSSPTVNTRLKNNENGMVMLQRNVYNDHPAKVLKPKQAKGKNASISNILKEDNRLKKTIDKNSNYNKVNNSHSKSYHIVFVSPEELNNKYSEVKCKFSLSEILPALDKNILPSEQWSIDYLPKISEPKDDKVYDRIAAELEDLMNNGKSKQEEKPIMPENKIDEFPSIMDILNDNGSDQNIQKDDNGRTEEKSNIQSNDVEAMLLGKATDNDKPDIPDPVHLNVDVEKLIEDVCPLNAEPDAKNVKNELPDNIENPQSPSILDETLQKVIAEQLLEPKIERNEENHQTEVDENVNKNQTKPEVSTDSPIPENITHLIFQMIIGEKCVKSVTCPKNLKYVIELDEKPVELLGAPKYISSLEDLKVLLQIVHESELNSPYVLH